MRLAVQSTRMPSVPQYSGLRLSAFGEGLKRPPSQKELASVLQVTTRHLRRWEMAEEAANCPCSRPYSHADLWRLYQRRRRKGWDRAFAAHLGLTNVFERFDQIRSVGVAHGSKDDRSIIAAMMLRSIAANSDETAVRPDSLPCMFVAGFAQAAKTQLRMIVDCAQARDILVKAFFEAAMIADATHVGQEVKPDSAAALSA